MKPMPFFAGKFRKAILLAFDCYVFGIITCAYYISFGLFKKPGLQIQLDILVPIFATAGIILVCNLIARLIFGVYHSVWRYTRTLSYLKLIIADIFGTAFSIAIVYAIGIDIGLEIFLILAPVGCLATISSRFCYRLFHKHTHKTGGVEKRKIRVAIIGAGQLGAFLANELLCNHQATYQPIFFIDNDPQKVGNNVVGLKVYHEDERLFKIIKKKNIEELFVAVANLDREEAEKLIEFYSRAKCKLKIYEIPVKDFNAIAEEATPKVIRDFQIEDLLFRKPMKINNAATRNFYNNKTILVTGGGGSIGSELCRQIARCSPKKLIILDIYENNAYEIQQELHRIYGDRLDLVIEIASVR
ncbi:MAG: polysaccharide biosynthesis protein, partial [Clostridia bacterium]|nr:polysaccharide biosynthesis protein [Clostridia bacterium]